MKRRALLGAVPALVAIRGAAAETKVARLAIVSPATAVTRMNMAAGGLYAGLLGELRRLGYAEGEALTVERHSADGHFDWMAPIVRAVVESKQDVVFAQSSETALLFKAATTTIPVVTYANNPVDRGLIESLARPGGNITGFSSSPGAEFTGKRLQFLHEAAPKASRIGFLASKGEWEQLLLPVLPQIQQGGLELLGSAEGALARESDYRRFFSDMARRKMDALVVTDTTDNARNVELIQSLVRKAQVPTIYPWRLGLRYGVLMSYGVDTLAAGAVLGDYVVRILKGANPADPPYQQPSKFELVLNLPGARQMHLKFPQSLLARADETLE
jgi:putative tryptophan/tyrosine transport system substrate-binding protein